MKPIELAVSGLHSFREKQIINFDTLCNGGIFGIFGPTGSGKSSILDAMTLALYGKVERATNNTHGILNHAEDQLTVAFTFELENASHRKRYTVERVFKRTDEVRVKTSICRLIEVGEETIVLADKAVDVNDHIHGLLGLTIDDFTRAVVLPQGKFAEFLSLKGAERRQMLQRLFHLEQYGDLLMKKLKRRLSSTRIKRNELEAEKTGLGDASVEAVKEAEKHLKEAELLLAKRQKELAEVTNVFEEKQQIWNLQQKKVEVQKEKSIIEAEGENITLVQNKLKKAEEAESLRPYAEALQVLRLEKKEAEINLEAVRKQYFDVKAQYESISQSYEEIRNKKAKQEPILVAKREKLLQLKKVEDELEKDRVTLKELNNKKDELQTERTESNKQLEHARRLAEKALAKQQALKDEQKNHVVSSKEREQIRVAIEQKQKVVQAKQRLMETEELVATKSAALEQAKQNRKVLIEKLSKGKNALHEQYNHLNKLYYLLCEREREHVGYIHVVKSLLTDLEEQVEKLKSQRLAQQLVQQLSDGEPCPVCGSCEHPNPSHEKEETTSDELEDQLKQVKRELEQLQSLSQEGQTLKVKLEGVSQQLLSEFSFLQEVIQIKNETAQELLTNPKELSVAEGLKVFKTEFKSIAQDYLEIKDLFERSVRKVKELQQEEMRQKDLISSAEKDVSEWYEKQQVFKQTYEQELKQYSKKAPTISLEDIERLQQEMNEKDRAYEQLNERIQKSITFIEDQEEMVKKQELRNRQVVEQEIELNISLKNLEQYIEEKQAKINEVQSNQPIRVQIEETISELEHLKNRENELYHLWQQHSNQLHDLQSKLAANEKTYDQTSHKLIEAEHKWKRACVNTSFKTIEETLASILEPAIKEKMKREVDTYTDKVKQLTIDLQRIVEKLAGKELSQEEWEQIQTISTEVKVQVEQAVANKGAATNALNVLLEKHDRYLSIEKEQKNLDDLLQKLEKLQSVFKGNSFVEYVAEEQLEQVSRNASERLIMLTRGRYAIEVDSQGGFIMRDDANGGVRRPVSTLSGGETFLTSLALALSLSTQIQLRGEYPLQFFFLDEGFGTLDVELLDTVITSLEKLQAQNLSVGVISHVQELRARLPKKLIVQPAEPSGKGSTVYLESF